MVSPFTFTPGKSVIYSKVILNVSTEEEQKMARFSKGYAYAYKIHGELVY